MLDVDEHGPAIGAFAQAGDFAILGANQEALERGGRGGFAHVGGHGFGAAIGQGVAQCFLATIAHLAGHGGQQHAVGLVGVGTIVGLNPADAGGFAEGQPIGGAQVVLIGQA